MMLQHCFRFGITVHVQVYPDLCVEVIYGFINVVISPPACSNAVECHYVGMVPVVFIAFRVCQFVGCTGNHHSDGLLVLRNFSVCQQAVSGIYFDAIRSLKNEIAGGKRADKAARTWNQAVYFECVAFACIKSCCTAGGSDCFLLIEYYIVCGIAALYLSFFLGGDDGTESPVIHFAGFYAVHGYLPRFCVRSPGGGLVAVGEAGIGGFYTGDVYLRFQYQQGELMGERQIECLTAGTFVAGVRAAGGNHQVGCGIFPGIGLVGSGWHGGGQRPDNHFFCLSGVDSDVFFVWIIGYVACSFVPVKVSVGSFPFVRFGGVCQPDVICTVCNRFIFDGKQSDGIVGGKPGDESVFLWDACGCFRRYR